MNLRKKLVLGFSSVLILMILVVLISAIMLHKQNEEMAEIVFNRYEKIELVTAIENERNFTAKNIRDVLLDPSTLNTEVINLIENSRLKANVTLQALLQITENEERRKLVTNLQIINQEYEQDIKQVLELLKSGEKDDAIHLFLTEEQKKIRTDMQEQGFALQDLEHQIMHDVLTRSEKSYTITLQLIVAFMVLALVIGIVVTILVIKGFSQSMNQISSSIASFRLGGIESLPRIDVISDDEIGKISLAFNQMAERLEHHAKQEDEFNQVLQDQNWIESKLSEITTMFQGIQDLDTLAELFIKKITPLLQASYGVFYLMREDGATRSLNSLASYAYNEAFIQRVDFRLGEGLVGQCALDQREILLHEIPEDYIKVRSGLGEASPKSLYLLPIIFETKVVAVLEFASFHGFNPLHQRLTERLSRNMGITLHSVARQMQVKSLLEQSQSLTEELQTQSEELQVQHEELRSINEQLAKQYHDSEKKTKELENTKRELEEQAKQLEISSQFKSEFLANMSHELRTPLNSMLILAQIFAENKEGNLTEKQVDYAHSIHYAGKDLLNLINDILDLSKVESGKIEIIPSKVSLSDIQRDIERQFIPVAAQKGLIFQIEPDQDPALTLTTDEQRVMQILKNLLSNAFKFTEEGRVILKFRTPQIHDFKKKNVPSNTVLAISVSDTGIGIPQEKQDIIFEAFRQADGTMSRKHGGTGLGLSISRELAQLLGGTLLVESEVGQGSTFTLYLPNLSLAISEAQPAPVEPTLGFSDLPFEVQVASSTEWNDLLGKKILIVDDDMRNVFALTTLFEKQNMSVVFAENGKDSIDTLLAHPGIDIILMDIMMPEMDGYTAMRAIRKIPDYHTIPIIALTAKAMKNDREKCIEAGASDYISKPINVEQLLSLIRVWLYPRKG